MTPDAVQTATVALAVSGRRIELTMSVPVEPVRHVEMLPLYQSLANSFVAAAEQKSVEDGKPISCKAGCGACCRQLVPILPRLEAHNIRAVVAAMPEPRRTEVLARFAAARARIEEAGLLDAILHPERIDMKEIIPVGLKYMDLRIPCPFLEAESCSIHPDRPLSCREYLVTNPAENCANPNPKNIDMVEVEAKVSKAVRYMTVADGLWVPLVTAPEWAETHPDTSPLRPGKEYVEELFGYLTRPPAPLA